MLTLFGQTVSISQEGEITLASLLVPSGSNIEDWRFHRTRFRDPSGSNFTLNALLNELTSFRVWPGINCFGIFKLRSKGMLGRAEETLNTACIIL